MPRQYLLPLTILVVSISACANTCGGEEKKPETTRAASTSADGGGHGGGSRFAKPYVPGAPPPAAIHDRDF